MSFALKGKLKILLNFNNISLKIIMETIMTLTVKFINIEKIANALNVKIKDLLDDNL